jgi:general secretion pathway protein C
MTNVASFGSLRTKHIETLVFALKYLFGGIIIFTFIFVGHTIITSYSETHTSIDTLFEATQVIPKATALGNDPNGSEKKDYSIIVEKNILGQLTGPTPGPTVSVTKPVAKIPLNLVGTFVSSQEPSSAIIEDQRKAQQEVFYLNEKIFGDAKLVAIFRDRVEIERGGQVEVLKLEDGGASGSGGGGGRESTATSGGEITVNEADVDSALSNLPLLLTEIRAVPYFKEGQAAGLRLFAIKSGSLFDKIGLKNGDILKSINGNPMGDFTQAVKLFERLKAERTLKVSLERNREEKEFTYQIR